MMSFSSGRKNKAKDKKRVRHCPVKYSHEILARFNGDQRAAHQMAAKIVAGVENSIKEGCHLDYISSKESQQSLGFWRSVAGYLGRDPKNLKKGIAA